MSDSTTNDMKKLTKCIKCGTKGKLIRDYTWERDGDWIVYCPQCKREAPLGMGATEEFAIEDWDFHHKVKKARRKKA